MQFAAQRHTHTHTHGVATISSLLKIIGLFCKRAFQRDYILQKRPIILRSLLIVSTPYEQTQTQTHTHTRTVQGLAGCSTAVHTQTHTLTHINAHTQTYTHTHTYHTGACGLQHQAFLALGAGKFAGRHSQKSVLYVCSIVTLVAS